MSETLPVLLIPGLNCTARLFAEQLPALWRLGPVTVANHTRDDTMAAIARRILAAAPPRFALAGLSMGGYIAFEIMRQAPDRVGKLALLDTSARSDTPEQTALRRQRMDEARAGHFREMVEASFPLLVHPNRVADPALRRVNGLMAEETGVDAYLREIAAIIARPDSRPDLARIHCPTLVLVGAQDQITPPAVAQEMAGGLGTAQLIVVPDCGHLSTLERPEMVTALLEAWLQG